jgi:hypothetical protein
MIACPGRPATVAREERLRVKVFCHLMFAILALTIDHLMRLVI